MTPQQKYWLKMGRAFGYPTCCIQSFLELRHIEDQVVRKLNGTGYIPCAQCNITKTKEQMIQEVNKTRSDDYPPFQDVEPEGMFIVMGRTTERVFEHSHIPLRRDAADWWASSLNYAYRKNRVAIEFYITQILDV